MAQLVARVLWEHEVEGSSPFTPTNRITKKNARDDRSHHGHLWWRGCGLFALVRIDVLGVRGDAQEEAEVEAGDHYVLFADLLRPRVDRALAVTMGVNGLAIDPHHHGSLVLAPADDERGILDDLHCGHGGRHGQGLATGRLEGEAGEAGTRGAGLGDGKCGGFGQCRGHFLPSGSYLYVSGMLMSSVVHGE